MSKRQNFVFKLQLQLEIWVVMLLLTLGFFLYKGILYASIGSFIPLAFILVMLAAFIYGYKKSLNAFKRVLTLWAVLILLWASARLLLIIVNSFITEIPQAHVSSQFGFAGTVLSLFMLFAGLQFLKK